MVCEPSACRMLSRLFMTRVKLVPPPEGPERVRHMEQVVRDEQELMARSNQQTLTQLLSSGR